MENPMNSTDQVIIWISADNSKKVRETYFPFKESKNLDFEKIRGKCFRWNYSTKRPALGSQLLSLCCWYII